MTGQDLTQFRVWFEDLWHSGLARTPQRDKLDSVLATYFQALEPYPIAGAKAAYEHLQHTAKNWPPVSEWIGAIRANPVLGLPAMDWRKVSESDDAERRFYEGDPCNCQECDQADATHLPLCYVPCLDASGNVIPMRHPKRNRPVLLGEWIHGFRLKRWYAAKAEFYMRLEALKLHRVMPAALVQTEPEEADSETVES